MLATAIDGTQSIDLNRSLQRSLASEALFLSTSEIGPSDYYGAPWDRALVLLAWRHQAADTIDYYHRVGHASGHQNFVEIDKNVLSVPPPEYPFWFGKILQHNIFLMDARSMVFTLKALEGQRALAQAALLALRERQRIGAYPEDLAGIPTSPLDDQQLIYEIHGDSVQITLPDGIPFWHAEKDNNPPTFTWRLP